MVRLRKKSASTVGFEAFGVRLELMFDDPTLEPKIREILPPGWAPARPDPGSTAFALRETGPDSYQVTIGGSPAVEHASLEVALTLLDSQIRLSIAANARDRLFVHAGVVAVDGRALVIPGATFTGKTTLVHALVRAGATYYSDEYAVLDDAGLVHPYPRPLSIRGTDGSAVRERTGPAGRVASCGERATTAAVVITRYRTGVTWEPKRLTSGQGMLALIANTVPAQARPQESLRTLGRAIAGATTLEGARGEAGPVATALLDELATLSRDDG
jgi:hypothetical protein